MAEQIYSKAFIARKFFTLGENDNDVRAKALKEVNEFLIKHDGFDVISIIEDWKLNREELHLTVYYKDYI